MMLKFLEKAPLGRVFLANAHTALKDTKPDKTVVANYLKSCNNFFITESPSTVEELIGGVDNKGCIFKRTPVPNLFGDLTTIINIQSFHTNNFKSLWLFTDNGNKKIRSQSRTRNTQAIDIIVNKLSDQTFIKSDAFIGKETQPLWVASDTELSKIVNIAPIKSDAARDALGLNVDKDIHLIRFSLKKVTFENHLKKGKSKFSAPTFIEAKSHKYFRASQVCKAGWGHTRHLLDPGNPGIREAVTTSMRYRVEDFEIEHLGQTTTDPLETTATHAEFLRGKNRTWKDIITDLQAVI